MQSATLPGTASFTQVTWKEENNFSETNLDASARMVVGLQFTFIKLVIWLQVYVLACRYFRNPVKAFKILKGLKAIRAGMRGQQKPLKYVKVSSRYYFTYAAPGFPSKAFNKYVLNNIKRLDADNQEPLLDTLVFAITKKCGYQCAHCFEWNALNKPEKLSRADLLSIVASFQETGITQLQLSGGEPLNRMDDILYLLQHIKKGTDVWVYSSGYHFTKERAAALKKEGLTGMVISLDHWQPALHNTFRGKSNAFEWAERAVHNAVQNGLAVCLSLCATREFITKENLAAYMELARAWGVSFVQVLEPKAVGHFAGMDVVLQEDQLQLLEDCLVTYNYKTTGQDYPIIVYHGFYSRQLACGGGWHYVYVDTDGDVHSCPFCQHKKFSALDDNVKENVRKMNAGQCSVFQNSIQTSWMQ